MTVVHHANWWCSTCGARGSGNGEAYAAWLRGHTCGMSVPNQPVVAKPAVWSTPEPQPVTQSVPGRMSFTVLERGRE